jgi:hypothetical protein
VIVRQCQVHHRPDHDLKKTSFPFLDQGSILH